VDWRLVLKERIAKTAKQGTHLLWLLLLMTGDR
jgi:hypothetical protein